MTIRDLGYRPYDGPRNPPSQNAWVMLRQGLLRAWGSWMVKLAVFLCWVPPVIAMAVVALARLADRGMDAEGGVEGVTALGIMYVFGASQEYLENAEPSAMQALFGSLVLRALFATQTWLFVSLVSAGAGASAVAEDFTFKAFQFYFAKPVTSVQYLLGRMLSVALFVLFVSLGPVLLVDAVLVMTAPPEQMLENLGLVLPAMVHGILLAGVVACAAVAISSLSQSRALTTSAWVFLFVVPAGVASVVQWLTDWPWLNLVSITGLLAVVADALFKVENESPLEWPHAVLVLVGLVAGSIALGLRRLRRAEVFG
jgi:ABC-type transport system involved in multi-copper enzyme maturation permease subunit